MIKLSSPINKDPLTLFEYCVRKVLVLGMMGESKTHQSWANIIFDYEWKSFVRSELMSIVKHEYSVYFDEELQYSFIEEKIKNNFPYLFGIEQDLNLFDRMLQALDAECVEQKSPRNRKIYRVLSCDNIATQDSQYIYKAQLAIEEGDDPHFSESMPFDFKNSDSIYKCAVVEYDYANGILFFSSERIIYYTPNSRVISDATLNTIALMNLIEEISLQKIGKDKPLNKFLIGNTNNLAHYNEIFYPQYLDSILISDHSQYTAFKAALTHDITFIWGPPGTGKSYTLSAVIMALHLIKNERTAVCCLSNAAVDQLLNKVIDLIEVHEPNMSKGVFYRAGRSQDERILATDFLFPDDYTSQSLRVKIKLYSSKINKFKEENKQYSEEAVKIKAKLKDVREKLKEHTDYLISKVKVIFSTISNFVINTRLKDGEFDNLIVDEASMLALPQLIALARKVTKRIILVGDFLQLSPITIAGVPILKNNVFKLSGIDINHTDHPALYQLLNQRRSNPMLVDLINHSFYGDRLNAKNNKNSSIVARAPYSGCVVGMYNVDDGAVRFTKGGTRQNTANADAVMDLLDIYSEDTEAYFSIGVITPYTGQVALLKAKFFSKEYEPDFQERVKIGTVHTFQGSECDVIIFDMVDCSKFEKGKKVYAGKIYAGSQGEQLLNVAISRAKHKLIIVCDPEYLSHCPGGVLSDKSIRTFNILLKARNTKI